MIKKKHTHSEKSELQQIKQNQIKKRKQKKTRSKFITKIKYTKIDKRTIYL